MSRPGEEDQRELERRALRKVRLLVEYMENTDQADDSGTDVRLQHEPTHLEHSAHTGPRTSLAR